MEAGICWDGRVIRSSLVFTSFGSLKLILCQGARASESVRAPGKSSHSDCCNCLLLSALLDSPPSFLAPFAWACRVEFHSLTVKAYKSAAPSSFAFLLKAVVSCWKASHALRLPADDRTECRRTKPITPAVQSAVASWFQWLQDPTPGAAVRRQVRS